MPITPNQIRSAVTIQHAAAHDTAQQIRVIAGPGTGKSFTIEERVCWLLESGIPPESIFTVSFTRASALDLRIRIRACCLNHGYAAHALSVTTLHALALRTLRAAGLLTAYPADPLVLDPWEVENIFDDEYKHSTGATKKRCQQIRQDHEAYWHTGQWNPPNYIPPDPPVSDVERQSFTAFHNPRTQTYSCVLPGEIIRLCVSHMNAGTINPVSLLGISHLIVDEYQDLNAIDLEFIDLITARGAVLFVAGDDDQSIYSFRYAFPSGIQDFVNRYPSSGRHELADCFRCTPSILRAGVALIDAFPGPNRVPKRHISLYEQSTPPLRGVTHYWKCSDGVNESRLIAQSCRRLIDTGLNPRCILILLSKRKNLWPTLATELDEAEVPYELPRAVGFLDSLPGRLVLSILRIVTNNSDYVANRELLGLLPHVGVGTCSSICNEVVSNNLNYHDIFYRPLPAGIFNRRAIAALNRARAICQQLFTWLGTDTLRVRKDEISALVEDFFDPAAVSPWDDYIALLPDDTTLEELRDFLWADTDEQQAGLLETILTRLNIPIPGNGLFRPKVRIMTMHGAKGLSGHIVFIPALEEEVLPGPWRLPYPGLVLEAARLLYVSITRARAACIMTFAENRVVNGRYQRQTPSRFCAHVDGAFTSRQDCLDDNEIREIADICNLL